MTSDDYPKLITTNEIAIVYTGGMQNIAVDVGKIMLNEGISHSIIHLHRKTFPNSEIQLQINDNVRRKEVFFLCDFNGDPNVAIMRCMLTLNALHLADAERITLVVPYIPYLRQDRKDKPRVPISAAVVLNMLQICPRLKHLVTIDMHADQLQSNFNIPSDHLPGHMIFGPWARYTLANELDQLVVVGPDFGSAKRVRKLAEAINSSTEVILIEKKRDSKGSEILSVNGPPPKGKICLINDDMIDTAGSMVKAIDALYKNGADKVIVSATHAVFSPKDGTTAYEKLEATGAEVVVTDSLNLTIQRPSWITVLPLAPYLAYTMIQHITRDGSVSRLINKGLPNEK